MAKMYACPEELHYTLLYNNKSQIKFKTSILKPTLCSYSDVYILLNRIITVTEVGGAGDAAARQAAIEIYANPIDMSQKLL